MLCPLTQPLPLVRSQSNVLTKTDWLRMLKKGPHRKHTDKPLHGKMIWPKVSNPFQILKADAVKVLHSICQQIWKTQQWPQDWKRSVFIPIRKKGNAKECSNYRTIALISHDSKVMLKILQARFQQYVNHEIPDIQAGFRKGGGNTDQTADIH